MMDFRARPVNNPVNVRIVITDLDGKMIDEVIFDIGMTANCAEQLVHYAQQHDYCRLAEDASSN